MSDWWAVEGREGGRGPPRACDRVEGIIAGGGKAHGMADEDEDENEGPVVELGDETPVEGQPLARVASRLTWPREGSRLLEKEGDAVIRTPSGPRTLSDVLDDVDSSYFETRKEFVNEVKSVVGTGPVETKQTKTK